MYLWISKLYVKTSNNVSRVEMEIVHYNIKESLSEIECLFTLSALPSQMDYLEIICE